MDPKAKRNTKKINPIVAQYFPVNNQPRNLVDVMQRYQRIFNLANKQWIYAIGAYTSKNNAAKAQGKEPLDPPKTMVDAQ